MKKCCLETHQAHQRMWKNGSQGDNEETIFSFNDCKNEDLETMKCSNEVKKRHT